MEKLTLSLKEVNELHKQLNPLMTFSYFLDDYCQKKLNEENLQCIEVVISPEFSKFYRKSILKVA